MASVVGQASAAATSVAIPAHAVGDLIIVAARGTAAAPVKPAAAGTVPAWDTLQSAIANSIGLTTVAFVATATNHTTGTFTSATHICVLVLRPDANKKLQYAAADSSTGNGNNTQTIIYPALTLNTLAGTSMGVRIGTRGVAITAVGTAPSGWTNQIIQPAGASALMSVHTRMALTANPTADTVTVTSSNAAYRAHTIEIEELPLLKDLGGVSVVGDATLAAQRDNIKTFAATVAGVGAVSVGMTVVPPPITFDIVIATNQPYAGEHTVGEFLVGDEDVLAVDLQIVAIDYLDGLIAGQATVAASLSVVRATAAGVTGVGSVTAQQNSARALAAALAGSGAVVAQENPFRGLAVPISGVGAVSADIIRVPQTVSFSASVQGAAAVVADTSISSIIVYTQFAAALSGQAALVTDQTINPGRSFLIQGQAQIAVAIGKTVSLGVSVQGQASVSVDRDAIKSMAVSIARTSAVVAQSSRVIMLDAYFGTIIPLVGEHLVGTFIVGGSSGPHAVITQDFVRTVNYPSTIEGQASLDALLRTSLPFAAAIQGQADIQADFVRKLALAASIEGKANLALIFGLRLYLASLIQGQAQVSAKMRIAWLTQTVPGDILLPPTTEVPWILVPTTDGTVALVPTEEESVTLAPTEEEDWLLVPTTERG